jgi:hypothetical protein
MQSAAREDLQAISADTDELDSEELNKRRRALNRRRTPFHAKRGFPPPLRSTDHVQFVPRSEDPIEDLNRKFDALTCVLAKLLDSQAEKPIETQVPEPSQPGVQTTQPQQWLDDHITRLGARLVRALWGKGACHRLSYGELCGSERACPFAKRSRAL